MTHRTLGLLASSLLLTSCALDGWGGLPWELDEPARPLQGATGTLFFGNEYITAGCAYGFDLMWFDEGGRADELAWSWRSFSEDACDGESVHASECDGTASQGQDGRVTLECASTPGPSTTLLTRHMRADMRVVHEDERATLTFDVWRKRAPDTFVLERTVTDTYGTRLTPNERTSRDHAHLTLELDRPLESLGSECRGARLGVVLSDDLEDQSYALDVSARRDGDTLSIGCGDSETFPEDTPNRYRLIELVGDAYSIENGALVGTTREESAWIDWAGRRAEGACTRERYEVPLEAWCEGR